MHGDRVAAPPDILFGKRIRRALKARFGKYPSPRGLATATVHSLERRPEMKMMKNVFDEILEKGHDEEFVPVETDDFVATAAAAGSREKIDTLARRVQLGLPLWHPNDRCDLAGLRKAASAVE
jgi:hypothetical protein